ncbi:MAG: PRC-barrel domain-containing protein [Cytophagales bacterium]|nr:PRC-barrel domain-containing protein [Armatimonadota bacterium]
MRTLGELSGLAVVGEGSGNKLGRIDDLLFESGTGEITAFLVHPGGLFHKAQLLPRLAVRALGTDALLVEQGHVLEDVTSEPALPGSLSAKSLDGRPILDDTGKYLGKASDVLVAEDTLTVTAVQYSTGVIASVLHGRPTVPFSVIKAIGADSIVVPVSAAEASNAAAAATPDPEASEASSPIP